MKKQMLSESLPVSYKTKNKEKPVQSPAGRVEDEDEDEEGDGRTKDFGRGIAQPPCDIRKHDVCAGPLALPFPVLPTLAPELGPTSDGQICKVQEYETATC